MAELPQHITVIVDIQDPSQLTETWVRKLRSLARRTPDGVHVALHETNEDNFGIKEVKAFYKSRAYKQAITSAQRDFYWLITNLNHKLVVACQECGLGYGQQKNCCRCPDKGSDLNGSWDYKLWEFDAESLVGWKIATSSLHRIRPHDLQGPGIGDVSRKRILELIGYLTTQ